METTGSFKSWLKAARLRTLPLAISAILTGSALAAKAEGEFFDFKITGLALLTAIFLQILSNFANDYGDFKKGTDSNASRKDRALASGKISAREMSYALILLVILCLSSGLYLLYAVFGDNINSAFVIMFLIGLGAIAAAIKYTVGKKAYGYLALGDLFVFLFFGPVAVLGTFFLHLPESQELFSKQNLLMSLVMGMLCAAVLNVNNMRDIVSDKASGKTTIPVLLGLSNAKYYHTFLIMSSGLIYLYLIIQLHQILSLATMISFITAFLLLFRLFSVLRLNEKMPRELYHKELKWLSLTIFLIPIALWL
jgi:1,4-dihydroxy-2-naphthoate polyprenyltransferase